MRKLAIALAILLAGCADPSQPLEPAAPQYQDDNIAVDIPVLQSDPPAAGERTLEAAPEWRLGEWWRIKFTNLFAGREYEFTRVVAGSQGSDYLVGFPSDGFVDDILAAHVPGFGDVAKADLSFETHDARFALLSFPLLDGTSWEVDFQNGAKGQAFATVTDGLAHIEAPLPGYNITAVYDSELGELQSFTIAGYITYEVIDHGYNHEGVVRVPHAHDLVFRHGRQSGVQPFGANAFTPDPQLPTETVEVDGTYDRLAFLIVLGGGPSQAGSGYYAERATAPDGTVYEVSLAPGEGAVRVASFSHEDPQGTWRLEHTAGGPGIVLFEGIAFHSIDIELPSGCVMESANAMHHGQLCRA